MVHKKLLMLFMFFILLATPLCSCWDWDNSVAYEENDMVAVIENAFGLPLIGNVLGKAELQNRKTVDEVLYAMPYGERNILEYKLYDWKDLYENGK